MNRPQQDPSPDPRLRQALGSLEQAPADQVDWVRLRQTINERAALPLASRRRQRRNRGHWLRPALPAAIAAGFALVVASQVIPSRTATDSQADPDVPTAFHPAVEAVLGTEISEFELDLLFGQVDADILVVAALDRP